MVKKRVYISKEELLQKVDNYSIFERYIGGIKLDKKFSSPLRSDSDPSCVITTSKNGSIYFKDYGTKEALDGIGFVAALYNLSFQDAINKIAYDFNIADTGGIIRDCKPIVYHSINKKKKEKFLSIGYRDFTEADLAYWEQFGITKQELIDNEVYSVKTAYLNGAPLPPAVDDLRFGYIIKDSYKDYVKIYSPHDKEWKWTSSAPNDIPFGFFQLTKGNFLSIEKSQKDRIISLKFYKNVIGLQSEGIKSLSEKTKIWLKKHYPEILYFGDNDETGLKVCEDYKEEGFKTHHFPIYYKNDYGIKDKADFVQKWGIDALRLYLKQNNLL